MHLQTEHDPSDVTTAECWGAADVLSQHGWSEQRTPLCVHRAYKLEFPGPLFSLSLQKAAGQAARAVCSQRKSTFQQCQGEIAQSWYKTSRKKAPVMPEEGPILGRSYTEPFHELRLHRVETLLALGGNS